jgi:hypothetical protein
MNLQGISGVGDEGRKSLKEGLKFSFVDVVAGVGHAQLLVDRLTRSVLLFDIQAQSAYL